MIFSVISNLLLHCIALYVFRQLTLKDESKVYLHPFPCHQGLLWPMGWVNHVLPLRFGHCIVFFSKLINFVCFSELLTSVPPGYWVEYSYIKKCPLAKNPEPSSSIFTRASSVTFAVLSCSDSPITCWSVGLINRSWHMIFRTLAVKYHIWLWRRLIKLLSSMMKQARHSQVVGSRCSCHPYCSRSRSQKQFLLMMQSSSFMGTVVTQVHVPYYWFISFNCRCSSSIWLPSLCKVEWWQTCLLFRILFLFSFIFLSCCWPLARFCSIILFHRSSGMICEFSNSIPASFETIGRPKPPYFAGN